MQKKTWGPEQDIGSILEALIQWPATTNSVLPESGEQGPDHEIKPNRLMLNNFPDV
jgi:hypothetical protein